MTTTPLVPVLFSLLARQRGAIGIFSPVRRIVAMPEGLENDAAEIVARVPDLELRGVLLSCKMARGQDMPAPQGPVVAYELLNDLPNGAHIVGFIREADFGSPLHPSVTSKVKSLSRPLVKTWTYNQLASFAERNPVVFL